MSLVRNLNEYKWELVGNKVILTNKKINSSFILDKVRLMSFIKFSPNCLDKMRIDESKSLHKSLKNIRDKNINEREKLHAVIKALKDKLSSKKPIQLKIENINENTINRKGNTKSDN